MKRPLPLLLFILLNVFQHACSAQQINLDSIRNTILRNLNNPEIASKYFELGKLYHSNNNDSLAIKYILEGSRIWTEQNKVDSAIKYLYVVSDIYDSKGLFDRSISNYELALTLIDNSEHSSDKAEIYRKMGITYRYMGNPQKAIESGKTAYRIAKTNIHDEVASVSLYDIGRAFIDLNGLDSSEAYLKGAEKELKQSGNLEVLGRTYGTLAYIFQYRSNLPVSVDYEYRALKIYQETGDKKSEGISLFNLAYNYIQQKEDSIALSYYIQSLKVFQEIESNDDIGSCLVGIGYVLLRQKKFNEAIDKFEEALNILKSTSDLYSQGKALENIGGAYIKLGNKVKAMSYLEKALETFTVINSYNDIAFVQVSIGYMFLKENNLDMALKYGNLSFENALKTSLPITLKRSSNLLYQVNKERGDFAKAIEMKELYVEMKDSIESQNNQRAVIRGQFKYQYEKEALADSLVFAKKEALSQAEIKRKGQQRNALMGGLGLITLFSGLLYNRFRVTRKQKEVIEVQKAEMEEKKEQVEKKNDEIMASITYAKKLQSAVLPPIRVVQEYFSESFLLYLPRDIVSGDFYWMESLNSPPGKEGSGEVISYFAVADCTGHGVPGAMLSVIGMNGLNRALNEQHLTQPKDILTSLSEHIQRHFEQSEATVRDGMDICLCALDNRTMKLTYAGANNPVWIARNGEMHILKADRRAIGHDDQNRAFTQQEFQLQKDDTVYLVSDGYQDQIGGEKNRKLMTKVFRERLVQLSALPMDEQRQTLLTEHEAWKGSGHQTDDICVMGIRV